MSSNNTVISVEHLSKAYLLGHQERHDTFFGSMASLVKAPVRNLRQLIRLNTFNLTRDDPVDTEDILWALKDVSFEVKKGESLGVIGRNGAGKSTLLKIISRVVEPTKGRIHMKGRVSALLEVGTGFHHELTGRENIYLNGTILGMKKNEIDRKFDEIVDFSGIEKFLDTPVKRYSTGMRVRLAFSVAAHLEPEILIVDEVLSVGDAEFQKKCLGKMQDVTTTQGRTVLFVSHNISAIRQLTSQCILLNNGTLTKKGKTEEVVSQYEEHISSSVWDRERDGPRKVTISTGSLSFQKLYYPEGNSLFYLDEPVKFIADIKSLSFTGCFRISLTLFYADGTPVGTTF